MKHIVWSVVLVVACGAEESVQVASVGPEADAAVRGNRPAGRDAGAPPDVRRPTPDAHVVPDAVRPAIPDAGASVPDAARPADDAAQVTCADPTFAGVGSCQAGTSCVPTGIAPRPGVEACDHDTCGWSYACAPTGTKQVGEHCAIRFPPDQDECAAPGHCGRIGGVATVDASTVCMEMCTYPGGSLSCGHLATERGLPASMTRCIGGTMPARSNGTEMITNLGGCLPPCAIGDTCPDGLTCTILVDPLNYTVFTGALRLACLPFGTRRQGDTCVDTDPYVCAPGLGCNQNGYGVGECQPLCDRDHDTCPGRCIFSDGSPNNAGVCRGIAQ